MEDKNQEDEKQEDAETSTSEDSESTENKEEPKTVPYGRFKEVNDAKKELEKKLKKRDSGQETTTRKSSSESDDFVTKDDLERSRLRDKGYKKETVDFIMRNGGENALDDPHVAKTVESMREQSDAEDAADVDTSSKSDKHRDLTEEEINSMSAEEMRRALSQ